MIRLVQWCLVGWSITAAVWWLIALALVAKRRRSEGVQSPASPRPVPPKTLSIFKPLPPLRSEPSPELVAALESFVGQLDEHAELLLGVQDSDRTQWLPIIEAWRGKYPGARLEAVCAPRPATFVSPKVSWHHTLATRARGEWWMWSDADIIAPAGFMPAVRAESASNHSSLVTCPYVVRSVGGGPTMLETLFVNVEFYPGVLACDTVGSTRFALGAAMLFDAAVFQRRVGWTAVGARFAEDNLMGQLMSPVKLSNTTLETVPSETRWSNAVSHYLRWHKTVRWVNPLGFAGQLLIVPVIGWAVLTALQPTSSTAWHGLLATMQMEVLMALLICRTIGCRTRLRHLPALEVWSVLRAATWIACWFPWPVVFRSQNRKWWSLYRYTTVD